MEKQDIFQPIPVILNGSNYGYWVEAIRGFLKGRPPGYTAHVMTFEVGAVLDDPNWQAPVYCFTDENEKQRTRRRSNSSFGRSMRGLRGMAYSAYHNM
ncbi:hypothetical protein PIB30_063317 [Stylosanthes scabra]|uniref:Retrotransposon Copia-like N-terminal domain-containing protein n=1 Tax=Stylosanthes scabra TaxID=79078 RepID=A0ABU6TNI8_9FABA|nr:hypothetical protein [Stylosanthes scabra]